MAMFWMNGWIAWVRSPRVPQHSPYLDLSEIPGHEGAVRKSGRCHHVHMSVYSVLPFGGGVAAEIVVKYAKDSCRTECSVLLGMLLRSSYLCGLIFKGPFKSLKLVSSLPHYRCLRSHVVVFHFLLLSLVIHWDPLLHCQHCQYVPCQHAA